MKILIERLDKTLFTEIKAHSCVRSASSPICLGNQVTELGYTDLSNMEVSPDGFLGNKDHAGSSFVYIMLKSL